MAEKVDPARKVLKIFVGYKTRLVPGAEKNLPEFKAPANYKDAAKIAAYQEEQRAAFLVNAKNMPYTGTFDEVCIIDPQGRSEKQPDKKKIKYLKFLHAAVEAEGKPPVSLRVRNFFEKNYPNAWTHDTHNRKPPEVIIVGFDPRTFLKIMGLECSMPAIETPAKLGLWYSNSDHRDIGEAVCPSEFKGLSLPYVIKQRRPNDPELGAHWDAMTAGWNGPGENPEQDAKIACELARQLGFLEDE